jgi:hypothetical protein
VVINHRTPASALFVVLLLAGVSGCGGAVQEDAANVAANANEVAVDVSPRDAEVGPGSSATFAAAVTGTANTAVSWRVVETGGGTIDAAGRYVAPQTLGTYRIVAASVADPSVSSTATVTVTSNPSPPPAPPATCATAPIRSTGTTYYYCDCGTGAAPGCVPGNDANPGTSPSAPRRSWSDAMGRFNSLNAGDTVALCRTGAWAAGGISPSNTRCRGGSAGWPAPDANTDTCDLRDYVPSWGSTSSPRPLLDNGSFSFWGSTGGYRFWNLDVRVPSGQTGIRIGDPAHHHDFCNANIQSKTRLGSCGGDQEIGIYATDPSPGPLSVRGGSRIAAFSMHGLLGGAADTLVDDTVWEDNGGLECYHPGGNCGATVYQNHQLYIHPNVLYPGVKRNQVWTNNEIVFRNVPCGGNMVGFTGAIDAARFENNYIHNDNSDPCGICGPLASGPTGNQSDVSNIIIRRNRTKATYGPDFACVGNAQITDNIFTNGLSIGGNDFGGAGCVATTHNAQVTNNTVYGGGLNIAGHVTGSVVRNNAVYGGSCSYGSSSQDHNYCFTSNPSAAWVNPSSDLRVANFTPVAGGPLDNTANQSVYSAIAVGTTSWNPSDDGVQRSAPIDIGAVAR